MQLFARFSGNNRKRRRKPAPFFAAIVTIRSINNQRANLGISRKDGTAVKSAQLDDKINVDFFRVEAFHQFIGSCHSSSGSEDIVVNHHDVVGADGLAMDFDDIGAVFLGLFLTDCVGREFARLAARHKASAELKGEDRAADEAARFDANDFGDALVAIELRQVPADDVKRTRIFESRSEILEKNTLRGEILHVADF